MNLYSNEIVFRGHPDKVCDQLSDALLDAYLKQDPYSRCGIEVMGGKGKIFVTGEVTSKANVNISKVINKTLHDIGYMDNYEIVDNLGKQSPDIALGTKVDIGGAGDQGMMFGYACDETPDCMPLTLDLSHRLLRELADIRREAKEMTWVKRGRLFTYLRPDSKSQVTVEYDEQNRPLRVTTIVISTQHDEFIAPVVDTEEGRKAADEAMRRRITEDVRNVLLPRV